MEPRDLAFIDWQKGMKPKQLSEKYSVSINTVKSWILRHWKTKAGAPEAAQKVHPPKRQGAPKNKTPSAAASVDQQIAEAVEQSEELTEPQKDFCCYFMRNRNATQAYLKAYGCTYATANTNGPALLVKTHIQEELRRLREIKNAALGSLCGDDVVELHMRIAFADITDFVEFKGKSVPVVHNGVPVTMEHPVTGKQIPLTKTVNEVKLKDSRMIDGQIINEVSEGRDGIKIKRADQQRSLAFLERYFELNPMNQHRKEYDLRRIEIEEKKVDAAGGAGAGATSSASEALVAALTEAYKTRRAANADD